MILIEYEVKKNDNIITICKKFNTSIDEIVNLNSTKYPGLLTNPFMVFYNWKLLLPLSHNGGNTQYDLYDGEVII